MFNHILLAIDDSPSGPAAVSFAMAMANNSQATVHVVHMNEFVVGGRGHTVETRDEAARVVAEAVAELKEVGVEASGQVGLSNCFAVADHVVEIADQSSADVIVVGSRRRSRWGGLRGQGVRERITELTSLPVMTAPPPLRLGVSGAPRRKNLRSLAHRSALANSPGLLISGVDADS